MFVMDYISQDNHDLHKILNLLSVLKKNAYAGKNLCLKPLLCELRDIFTLYWSVKNTVIYQNQHFNNDTHLHHLALNQFYEKLKLMLNVCIRNVDQHETLDKSAQFDLVIDLLCCYLDKEFDYLKDLLPDHFSAAELKTMGAVYEQQKVQICHYL